MTSVPRTWSTTSAVAWTKALEAAREVSGSWVIPASEHDRLRHLAEVGLADGPASPLSTSVAIVTRRPVGAQHEYRRSRRVWLALCGFRRARTTRGGQRTGRRKLRERVRA